MTDESGAVIKDANYYKKRKDEAYTERNRVVAALATCFPSGIAETDISGWDPEWHGCVYIDLPTGQVSWHFHDKDAHLFSHLPSYEGEWDGHDTPEKYNRVENLCKESFSKKRAFVVTAIRQTDNVIGYRSRLWYADSEAEAIGLHMMSLHENEPDATFSQPSAIEVP